jgi:hypothetical protein
MTMKTPRDLLLSRHAAAQPNLDALRRQVVAEHLGPASLEEAAPPHGFVRALWVELFWPSRRAWAGLAAVWVVVLGLNLAARQRSSEPTALVNQSSPARELRLVLVEQARLRAELLQIEPLPGTEPPKRSIPGPRSERLPIAGPTSA